MPAIKKKIPGRVEHSEARLKLIDELLHKYQHVGNRKAFLEKVNRRLEEPISDRTLDNDINYLKQKLDDENTGVSLRYSPSKGYHYSEPGFSFFKDDLNTQDSRMLDLARNMFAFFKGTSLQQRFEQVVYKVSKNHQQLPYAEHMLQPDTLQLNLPDTEKVTRWIEPLLEAIFNKETRLMEYETFEKGTGKKLISPYLLRHYRNRWFLVAHDEYCERPEKVNVFALESIRDLQPSNKNFYSDPDFNASDYFRYSLGIWHWHNRPPMKVKLQFNDYITMIQNNPLHHSQKAVTNKSGDILNVEIEVYDSPELEQLILGYGEHVKVLLPSSLAKRIAVKLKKASLLYRIRKNKK